eukprot:gb/GEZJ01006881.1/.p1 GENE.gb/GEZJ01006881.1/~~gb/GEZJ01006881.1/.p1  ORF type:complete len:118 (+),score=14.45 gb/GEZJ01006881.1/:261-614(+)
MTCIVLSFRKVPDANDFSFSLSLVWPSSATFHRNLALPLRSKMVPEAIDLNFILADALKVPRSFHRVHVNTYTLQLPHTANLAMASGTLSVSAVALQVLVDKSRLLPAKRFESAKQY